MGARLLLPSTAQAEGARGAVAIPVLALAIIVFMEDALH
jgi:hypothetical protein